MRIQQSVFHLRKINSVCSKFDRRNVNPFSIQNRKFSSSNEANSSSRSDSFPTKCDAVIIGGGSIGCSTLYHLTKLGFKNVALIERNKLTSGTTWHTAGLVWSLRPNDTDIQLLRITRELLGRLESETGLHSGWNHNGGLFLASTKVRLDEYKRLHTVGKAFGIESEVLSPKEAAEKYPILDPSTLYGTIFSKSDGNLDPSSFCTALTRFAMREGAQIVENCPVTAIRTKSTTFGNKQIEGVETKLGFIESPIVINCTGAWAPQICNYVGISIPLVAMKHSYVVFDKIDEVKTVPNIRDHDEGIYLRIQSDSLSIGGYEMNPIILDKVQEDFAFGLYELDWDVFGRHIEGATRRIPMLANVGIKSTICGPESFTPDHKPLLGEDPTIQGFFHGCGFNSAGMMFSGGCGSQLAKWVVNGVPDLDMYAFDIRRFLPKLSRNAEWVKQRSHEAYAKNYSIVFKHDEPLGGRNQLLSPLHAVLQDKGCVFQERQGWERAGHFEKSNKSPVQAYDWYGQYGNKPNSDQSYVDQLQKEYSFEFTSTHEQVREECENCRKNVSIFDMSYFGKFFLIGKDALKAAQYLFTNQMDKKPGSITYTCFLNKNGGTEADLTVTVLDEGHRMPEDPAFEGKGFYLAVGGTTAYYTQAGLLSVLKSKGYDVQLIDKSEDYGMMSIQGPKSRSLLQELFKGDGKFDEGDFPFSTHQILQLNGVPLRVMRVTFVGELGWELHVPKTHCVPVYQEVMRIGEKYGLKDAGYRAIDSLSIEKGYRHWHADLRSDDTPLEACLGFTCKLNTDIDFLGRPALEAQKKAGIQKRLTCFTLEEIGQHRPIWGLEAIWTESSGNNDVGQLVPVGYLRTADYSFSLGKSIGFGYVQKLANEDGKSWIKEIEKKKYWIEIMGEKVPAKAHLKSPFDPQNLRIKGVY